MPDVADDVKYSEICNKTKTTVVDCPLWMLTKIVLERKKKEIFRDQRYSVQKEDSLSNMKIARETIFVMISILVFCNKKIFESCKSFLFLLEERKNGVWGILSGRVF